MSPTMKPRPTEPCSFCKKNVVAPCTNTMLAAVCSQNRQPALDAVAAALEVPPVNPAPTPEEIAADAKPVPPFTSDDAVALLRKAAQSTPKPTEVQIGGDHYKTMPIQPLTYIQVNELDFEEGNIIKYVSRWRKKNGIEDLKKARDMLDKKIAFEEAKAQRGLMEYLSGLFKSV